MYSYVAKRAAEHFGAIEPTIITWAPGRANIIGGHTDYNDGFVLPIAINLGTCIGAYPRGDSLCRLYTANLNNNIQINSQCPSSRGDWSDYIAGVAWALQERGYPVKGLDMFIYSTVPLGGGLSSSAALEVAACLAWETAGRFALDPIERARLCQHAENDFTGMQCGLMDQLTACISEKGQAMQIDFASMNMRHVDLPETVEFMVCNSNRPRQLTTSLYNDIRLECEKAAHSLGVRHLSELNGDALDHIGEQLSEAQQRRVVHVVNENRRVRDATNALIAGDVETCGGLLNESHSSLRDNYMVSCDELEVLQGLCQELDCCYGARLVGGGFGGCVLALMRRGTSAGIMKDLVNTYELKTGLKPTVFILRSAGKAQVLRRS